MPASSNFIALLQPAPPKRIRRFHSQEPRAKSQKSAAERFFWLNCYQSRYDKGSTMCPFVRSPVKIFLLGLFTVSGLNASSQPSVKFIENKNQWDNDIDFVSAIPGGRMVVSAASFKYFFYDYAEADRRHARPYEDQTDDMSNRPDIRGHALFVTFQGANKYSVPQPLGRSDEYYNYFLGKDSSRWATEAHAYQGVFYESFYPGVDLKVYAAGDNVKYDFAVAPNADPSVIRSTYQGGEKVYIENGSLFITTPLAEVIEKRPTAWQIIGEDKISVTCEFRLEHNTLSFAFPDGFDSCYELVIDPLLIFSTYSGSTADNWGSTATPGEHGDLYSAGVTNQEAGGVFPATPGAFQTTSGGFYDISILKYDSLGSRLLFATYLGGANAESPHSLVMNDAGELIVMGSTSSADFPTTTGAFDRTFNSGPFIPWVVGYEYSEGSDIIISRFSADGKALLASTFVGGSNNDGINPLDGELSKNYGDQLRGDIVPDVSGNVYVSTVTSSLDFPAMNGFSTSYHGGSTDAIIFKMDPMLSTIEWGAFVGGTGTDAAHTIKLDAMNNVFAAGGTSSANLPVTAAAYHDAYSGSVDGWIAKIASDGSALLRCTYTGTSAYNQIYFLDLNADEEVYVYGQTSGDFPITPGVYSNPHSGQFIQKFSNELDSLEFSTVFGAGRGIPDISPTAFLVNDCNNLYMAGWGGEINSGLGFWQSGTTGMTTTPDAFQLTTSGSDFYFIVLTENARERLYATFLGGNLSRTHVDGGTSRFDKGGIVYHSVCAGCVAFNPSRGPTSDFPTTTDAWSRTNKSNNCNNAAFKFDLSSLKARFRTNSVKRDRPGLSIVCIPEGIVFENRSIGGETFEWDFGDGTAVSKTDTTFITHQYKGPGRYLVKLRAIDKGTCAGVDETSSYVTVNMAESFIQDDADVCFNDPYQLQASGAATYSWTSDDGMFASQEASPFVTPPDTTVYYITLVEQNGCLRKDTVTLDVIPAINPEFEWEKESECVARPEISVRNLTDSLESADVLFFDFGDGTTSDREEEEHYYEADGVYNIKLVARREFCVWENTVAIPVFEMLIPNVITPGTPGHNDIFTIRYGKTDGVTPGDYGFKVAVKIYNRWGKLVYENDDYHYDWSGQGLDAGTYYYDVSVAGHATCKSWLQLIK
jgi:hypothetical protein